MVKHHLPPGLDVEAGKEINGWILSFIEPRRCYMLFPTEIKENDIPEHYFFIVVKKGEPTKHFPGFVPYEKLFEINLSGLINDWIKEMEGRL